MKARTSKKNNEGEKIIIRRIKNMEKIYIIKKIFVTENKIESEVEAFETEAARDRAWIELVNQHNTMMKECHGYILSDPEMEIEDEDIEQPDFEYNWDDQYLECYNRLDPSEEAYYFNKDEVKLLDNEYKEVR